MLCEKCKKKTATVFYNENINGKVRSFSLCGECAAKMREKGELQEITSMIGSFADPFSELHDGFFGNFFGMPFSEGLPGEKKCPTCGTSYGEIAKTGLVGCPDCYKTFQRELSGTIGSFHGTTSHKGLIPSKHRAKMQMEEKLKDLKQQLEAAVKSENYETAAKLRDEIKALSGEKKKEEN